MIAADALLNGYLGLSVRNRKFNYEREFPGNFKNCMPVWVYKGEGLTTEAEAEIRSSFQCNFPYFAMKSAHWQKFQNLHTGSIYCLSTPRAAIELIVTLWATVSGLRTVFHNCNIWA